MKVIALAAASAIVVAPASSDWLAKPREADLNRYHPVAARQASVSGAATVRCAISEGGSLSDCIVVSEAPEGWGFGDAALGLARWYRLGGPSRDKLLASSGAVEVAMSFPLAGALGGAAEGEGRPRWIRDIPRSQWAKLPGVMDMVGAYPDDAVRAHVEGSGTVDCIIGGDGRLRPCSVVSEQPSTAAFGIAALQLAAKFQLKPRYVKDAGIAGGVFRLPIRFTLPSR
ncbi:TonB family protein [Phenylobacterium sp.]|jgi:TonB family protein|uniref:TonB family protein n=1 Tax=Phenylobacterium sp. TaxID=1871053 RepID=UPI002E36153E|nr:TonB family protein [Phenylobacterium sp.]HEX2561031.1 TonB family protein [Phenylobacterium sp.]